VKPLLFIACFALAACASLPSGAVAGPSAGLGETATVGTLRIRPLSVVEDSRCPINARCIWAGRMILRAEIRSRGRAVTRDLTLGEPIAYEGGRLSLSAAEPGRTAGRPTATNAYLFTFQYER
jgi:hypothetical protein